jgi:hypothetical protein
MSLAANGSVFVAYPENNVESENDIFQTAANFTMIPPIFSNVGHFLLYFYFTTFPPK